MGNVFLKELKGKMLRSALDKCIIEIKDHIRSEMEMSQFIQKIGQDPLPYDNLQFRMFILINYKEE